ncbi:MAG: DNA methyltransferase, partial [Acidimicrobiia bacterium]
MFDSSEYHPTRGAVSASRLHLEEPGNLPRDTQRAVATEVELQLSGRQAGECAEGVPVQLRLMDGATSPAFEPLSTDTAALEPREPDRAEIMGRKGSIYYRAHSYHTKVPPEGIARLIEHYTDPGDWVLDPFCGSGMTGVASLMSGRQGLLSDLSPAAVHIANNYVTPIDPALFASSAATLLTQQSSLERFLYGTPCTSCRGGAVIEYTVWSDVFACPTCATEIVFWLGGVDATTGAVAPTIHCSGCGADWAKRSLRWSTSVPVLQSVRCATCRKRWQEPISDAARARGQSFDADSIPHWHPTTPFEPSRE